MKIIVLYVSFLVVVVNLYAEDSYSVLDAKYAIGESWIKQEMDIKRNETFGEYSEAEIAGYEIGMRQEMESMNLEFTFNTEGEMIMSMYGEKQGPIQYRINGDILEIFQEQNEIWIDFGEFSQGYNLLTLTLMNNLLLDYVEE